jgi:hypothetical protein
MEALIRVWRDESEVDVHLGRRRLPEWGNQIIRYDNTEPENLPFTAGHAARLLFNDARIRQINLYLPLSIEDATGARRAMVGFTENLAGLHIGKVALITGGSAGIGGAVARLLALGGAKVVLAARRASELEVVRARIVGELEDIGYSGAERRVLEIGAGPGSITKLLQAVGKCRVTALEIDSEAIKKLTAQMEAGDVSPFELTQARLALNRTRLALQDAQRISVTAEAKLAAAIGVPLAALRAVRLDFSPLTRLPQAAPETTQRLALTQRADLMALLAEYAAAEAALHLEIAKQYPDVRLSPGFDYNQGQNRWQLGMSADLPLNGNRGPIAQAEAKRKTAEARFLAQQSAIQGELDIALAAYRASRAKAGVAADLAKEAVASADTTRRMVEAGDVSPLELTRRQIETSAADLALMAARIEAQTAAGVLEDAMQVPLP